jgi:allantoinase
MNKTPTTFALKSKRVILPDGERPATLLVRDGRIAEIDPLSGRDEPAEDLGELAVLPGIVDTHAHINEPGRTEWEGFETATRAAAAGGITTVIDMPLNSIPATTSLAALKTKAASAEGHCSIDYGFWGGVIPGNSRELRPMIEAGVFGFKAFLCPSGVEEFPHVDEKELRRAMPILAQAQVPLLVHAEIESAVSPDGDPSKYQTYLDSRPQAWEIEAIRLMIRLARETGCRTHIVHLSASDALGELIAARAQGVPITAETCPHYLAFDAEAIEKGHTEFKCAPPIREKANREKLWKAVREGAIEFIVSDHSPCTPALKPKGDFSKAWGGIAGLQFSLPAVWSEMSARGFKLSDLSRLMSRNTAHFLGLAKGEISPGHDADLIVFDPDASFIPQESDVLHRHRLTPYAGHQLQGKVHRTYLRGRKIYDAGQFAKPSGQVLKRSLS